MTANNFFTKTPYLISISLITLLLWYFKLDNIGISVYLTICFFILIFSRNTIHITVFLLNMLFMISQTDWNLELIPIYLYIAPGLLMLGMIIHAIRFKVHIFKGSFFLGIALFSLSMIVSTLVNTENYTLITYMVFVVALLFTVFYGFFANTIKGDNLKYIIRVLTILGGLISLQVLIYYLEIYIEFGADQVNAALSNKVIDLGWGISNFVATYLIMFMCALTYYVKKYRLSLFWIMLFLFEFAMLLFTVSRAGVIAFLFTSIFLLVFMFVGYHHKLKLLLHMFIAIIVVGSLAYFAREYFITVFERLKLFGLDDTGRIRIWEEAIAIIKANPWFGNGVFARSIGVDANELRMFHNTILHVLACFGILGGVALVVQFLSILKIFLTKINAEKAILLIAIIGANIHGMVDNIYLMPQYMLIMFIIIAVAENANKTYILDKDLETGKL